MSTATTTQTVLTVVASRATRLATPDVPTSEQLAAVAQLTRHIEVNLDTGCWIWTGCINRQNGYGKVQVAGRVLWAHRASYEAFHGPIPDGHQIDHLCRTRACINPAHLEAVTPSENLRRGYAARGFDTQCRNGHDRAEHGYERTRRDGRTIRDCRACYRTRNRARRATARAHHQPSNKRSN